MTTNSVDSIKSFFDSTKNIIYFITLGLVLIIITYGTNISKNQIMSLFVKIGIIMLYLYVFTIIYNSLSPIYNMKGLFIDSSMTSVRSFFLLYCLFELSLILLVFYIFYTIFK